MNEHNRREMTRVPLQLDLTLQSNSKATVPGKTTDVSLKGVHITCDNPLPVGSSCQLVLLFGAQEEAVRVELGGTVVRADRHGMAVEIENVLPIDTVTHLRNVVRYNAAEVEQIDQELQNRVSRRWNHTTDLGCEK
jgi:hypothetical protein